jgi:hypothetical protein
MVEVMPPKHRWGRIATVTLLVILGFPLSRLGCELVEFRQARYDTYSAAVAAGAGERGWLPSFVPASAVEIHELHSLDTNAQWLRFTVPASEVERMTSSMSMLSLEEARRTGVNRPWRVGGGWPAELNRIVVDTGGSDHVRFFKSSDGTFCLAVVAQEGHVFAWRCDRVV